MFPLYFLHVLQTIKGRLGNLVHLGNLVFSLSVGISLLSFRYYRCTSPHQVSHHQSGMGSTSPRKEEGFLAWLAQNPIDPEDLSAGKHEYLGKAGIECKEPDKLIYSEIEIKVEDEHDPINTIGTDNKAPLPAAFVPPSWVRIKQGLTNESGAIENGQLKQKKHFYRHDR